MRYAAILNPAAKNGKAGAATEALRRSFDRAGLDVQIRLTAGPGHAPDLVRDVISQADAVVAIGGDGTVHEVAAGLLSCKPARPMGIIPFGTGNDFARMMGIPLSTEKAVRMLEKAAPRPVDVGFVRWEEAGRGREHPFINAIGMGFDARVAAEAHAFKKLPGIAAYLASVLRTLHQWKAPRVKIFGDDLLFDGELLLVTAGIGVSSGGGFYLTPHASNTDGLFDLCVVAQASPFRILSILPFALKGRHLWADEVQIFRSASLQVESDLEIPLHADGEILTTRLRRATARCVRGGLSVLVAD